MAKPLTRKEQILAGKDIKPLTRAEQFLKEHVEESGGGGGSEPFVVTFTASSGSTGSLSADKSYSEICEALDAGMRVEAWMAAAGYTTFKSVPLTGRSTGELSTPTLLIFSSASPSGERNIIIQTILIDQNNTVEMRTVTLNG